MMTDKILICTDLDRTLIPNGAQPASPQAMGIFRQLVARPEIRLAYVSGRHLQLLHDAIAEFDLPVPDFAIGDVGTTIYEITDNRWQLWPLWEQEIDQDWQPYRHQDLQEWLTDLAQLELQETEKQNRHKLSYYCPADIQSEDLLAQIHQKLSARPVHYNLIWSIDEIKQVGLIDVLPQRANKLHAIRFLMQQKGFQASNTVFSGDSGNDLEVLCSDLQATLVNNASAAVKQTAVQMARDMGTADHLYLAQGDFLEMNGNYAAGILEGIAHYLPLTREWMTAAANRLG